jgi:uncharacterized protein YjiS (DUF1127 family)
MNLAHASYEKASFAQLQSATYQRGETGTWHMKVAHMSIRSSHATLAFDVGRASRPARKASWFRRAVHLAAAWHERARQRRELRSLDVRMLKDVGLTRADVDIEVAKPFWLP